MKLLYIWYKRSEGILEGGGHGSLRNYRLVCEAVGEENVDSYYIHDETRKKNPFAKVFGAFWFVLGYFYGLSPMRVRKISRLAKGYDCVFIDRSLFGPIAKRLKQDGYQGKVVSFFHNIEKVYFEARMGGKLPFRNLVINCADKGDLLSCSYADTVCALSQRDSDYLKEHYGRAADVIVSVTFPDAFAGVKVLGEEGALTSRKPLCLFLGAYYRANNDAILWFVENVLPEVDIRMRVVGRDMARLLSEHPELGAVEVFSDVPDIRPYLEEADIVILPIFSGSGMKIKTCESLMYGKNILGTDEAFAGYEIDYAEVGGLCNTAEDFIASINSFISSPRPRFNAYSRQVYLEKYSNAAAAEAFRKIVDPSLRSK